MRSIKKPKDGEFPLYANMYIQLLPDDGLLLKHLKDNFIATKELILSLSQGKLNYRYAENKWTIKEVMVHIIDDERIYAYRALRFARNDKTELPGFEENDYAPASKAGKRKIKSILREYSALRKSTEQLFRSFDEDMMMRSGIASNNPMSVRALLYVILGHQKHHLGIIKERYLNPDYKPETTGTAQS